MQFGIFLPNGSNGYILSEASPVYTPTYAHNLAIAQEAERYGLDFLISMIKFRGFGGSTGYWDHCLESFTLTAALATGTSKIRMFASVGIPSIHPVVAAKMIATLDDISGGRVGLNIVTGWNRPEYDQMGLWPANDYHSWRYDYATEYVKIVRDLWSEGKADFQSEHFQLDDCQSFPKPENEIQIVCAGQSPRGVEFTSQYGDYNFVFAPAERLKQITSTMAVKAEGFGRTVGTLGCFTLIAAETDEEADALTQKIIDDADVGAIRNMITSADADTNQGGSSDNLKQALAWDAKQGNSAYMSIPVISGSFESCARQIDEIAAESGISGIIWVFPDYVTGVRNFGEHIMPKLTCTGATTAAAA